MPTLRKIKPKREDTMGRFSVEFEVANNTDLVRSDFGDISDDQVRRIRLRGVVDSGATHLVLPRSVAQQLGLTASEKVKVRHADGRQAQRDKVANVHVTLLGRQEVFSAIVEPKRDSALIGAIVLEALDLLVDCTHQRLAPRDPKMIMSEIE